MLYNKKVYNIPVKIYLLNIKSMKLENKKNISVLKKVSVLALLTVSLASCGQKKESEVETTKTTNIKVEQPIDALKANQISFIEKLDSLVVYKKSGITNWELKFDISAKEALIKGKLKYDFKFDQKTESSDWTFDIVFDADIKEWQKMKVDWNISAQLSAFKEKIYFKLAKINLNSSESSQEIAMANGMAQAYLGKWFFAEIPENNSIDFSKGDFLTKKKKVLAILKKYPIFKSIKENKSSDYYDNDIELNKENAVKIVKEIAKEFAKEGKEEISADELKILKNNIDEFNKGFKGNIKIDKKDLKFFILNIENDEINFKLENTKNKFVINSIEKSWWEVSYNWKKTDNSIDGKILVKEGSKTKFSWNLLLKKEAEKYIIDLKWKADEEDATFNFFFTNSTIEKSVTIKEPENAKNIKEAMWALMWGGMVQDNDKPLIK